MINKLSKKFFYYLTIILIFLLITNQQNANEILIFADQITYDQKNNIIAKGKAKILYENQIISSDLIIYSQNTGDITLPVEFSFYHQHISHLTTINLLFLLDFPQLASNLSVQEELFLFVRY